MEQREIIFRGLTVDTREWIYGSLTRKDNIDLIGAYVITPPTMSDPGGDTIWYEEPVIRSSVSQYTGCKDESGVEIYEGDLLRCLDEIVTVFYNSAHACFDTEYAGGDCEPLVENGRGTDVFCVIGNIHENPELS
jgi:hypothetical protein